ncbi:MAG TPA: DUF4157 domain-containing protein [Thermoanaerobaculia bacterium]|nr:DUF4157 domain-containing protein [Thermoanaerobaculia bacterium]
MEALRLLAMTPTQPSLAGTSHRGGGTALQGTFLTGRPMPRGIKTGRVMQAKGYALEMPANLLQRRGQGKPIPETVRQKMETALGADFSDVRIHVGAEASGIGALAFAHGSDLYFAPGLYDPHTTHGQRLLGHELAHVVQQRNGRVRNPFGSGVAVVQDPALEAEAERLGMMAAAQIQRKEAPQKAPGTASACGAGTPTGGCGVRQAKLARPSGQTFAPHVANALGLEPAPAPAGRTVGVSQPRGAAPHPQAAHVQKAVRTAFGGKTPASPVAPRATTTQARPAAPPPAGGYRLIVGTYLHQTERNERLPEDLAGHTFVAVQEPTGRRHAWGFSPEGYSRMDARRDLGRLTSGVNGHVHGDEHAFAKPGVRTRSYHVSAEQAQAAMAKVAEYRHRHPTFSLARRPCSSFALDVARAGGVDPFPGATLKRPREIYGQL